MDYYQTVLIGLGNMGRNHLRTLLAAEKFVLKAVLEPNRDHENWTHVPANIKRLHSLSEIMEGQFELAIVASPSQTHYEIGQDLIAKGLQVLMEKPLASSSAEGLKLIEQAIVRGSKLAVGHVERCNAVVTLLENILAQDILGDILQVAAIRGGAYPAAVKPGNNVILDLAIHDLDLLQSHLGSLQLLGAAGHCARQAGIVDCVDLNLKSSSGVSVQVTANWYSPQRLRELRIVGTKASCRVDFLNQKCVVTGINLQAAIEGLLQRQVEFVEEGAAQRFDLPAPKVMPLTKQLDELFAFLNGEESRLANGADVVETLKICERADQLIRNDAGQSAAFAGAVPAQSSPSTGSIK